MLAMNPTTTSLLSGCLPHRPDAVVGPLDRITTASDFSISYCAEEYAFIIWKSPYLRGGGCPGIGRILRWVSAREFFSGTHSVIFCFEEPAKHTVTFSSVELVFLSSID